MTRLLLLILLASPSLASAHPAESIGDPFPARTNGVLTITADLVRDSLPVAAVPAGHTVTWSAFTSDGKPALLWCDRPALEDCSGRFTARGTMQARAGYPVRHGMPNQDIALAGKTVTLWTTISRDTATGGTTVARERRDLVFASAGATPTSPPAPTPTPREPVWGIRTTIRQ